MDTYNTLVGDLDENKWSHTSALPVCLHGMDNDSFTLLYFANGYF